MSPYSQALGPFPFRGAQAGKVVALTFDDGPNEPYTSQIAEMLGERRIRATFFQVGRAVLRHPEVTARLAAGGHVVGNHGFTPEITNYLTAGTLAEDVRKGQAALLSAWLIPALYRPPWLLRIPALREVLAKHGLRAVSGEFCHPLEVLQPPPEVIARAALRRVRPGSILIFHGGHDGRAGNRASTVIAARIVADRLIQRGYSFMTVDELLGVASYQLPAPGPPGALRTAGGEPDGRQSADRFERAIMPFLLLIAICAVRIARRPLDPRLKKRQAGPLTIAALGVVLYLAWDWLRPGGLSTAYFAGEFAGVTSVYLMTWTLVLATRLRWMEQWFGGLDRMYYWHKQCALWSVLLLVPHILITGHGQPGTALQAAQLAQTGRVLGVASAVGLLLLAAVSLARVGRLLRLPYQRWLAVHRLIGLLVLIALAHGWALDQIIGRSAVLMGIYVFVGAVAMAAYGYAELVMRHRSPQGDYTVASVRHPAPDVADVSLVPAGEAALSVRAGQFVYLRAGASAWREHPFSVAGTGPDGSVRLTIRGLGKNTRRLAADLREGLPATLRGPYGMFDHTVGGPRQIWIAGGIGIAPFLGWASDLGRSALTRADLFYCTATAADAPFLPDLTAAARRQPALRLHPVYSRSQGRLTISKIRDAAGPITPDTHVFVCGPASMVRDLTAGLRRHGISPQNVHAEFFAFR